jgi:hypothetical protein
VTHNDGREALTKLSARQKEAALRRTTIAAFAALITASHRGISSLGWVLSLGVGFILLAAASPAPACNRTRRDSPGELFSNPLSDDACDSSTPGFRR